MKKLLCIFLLALSVISCSKSTDKAVNALSKEIGASPIVNKFSSKEVNYQWEKVNIGKGDILKNIVDKQLNMLPTKTQDLSPVYDEQANVVKNEYQKYYVYESPKFNIELDYTYFSSDQMTIDLRVVNK